MTSSQKGSSVLDKIEVHIENMFLAGIIMGAICCVARPDFNLPMFAFLYVMFRQDDVSRSRVLKCGLAERQSKTVGVDVAGRAGRPTLDVLLGSLLDERRDGQVEQRRAQRGDALFPRRVRAQNSDSGCSDHDQQGATQQRSRSLIPKMLLIDFTLSCALQGLI